MEICPKREFPQAEEPESAMPAPRVQNPGLMEGKVLTDWDYLNP